MCKGSVKILREARSNATLRATPKLRLEIGITQIIKLQGAGFEPRLYRNESAE